MSVTFDLYSGVTVTLWMLMREKIVKMIIAHLLTLVSWVERMLRSV